MQLSQIESVKEFEDYVLQFPQVTIETSHLFHSGIYTRTILIPAGVVMTGALIKIPTTLIISGDVTVTVGDGSMRLTGYNVISASSGRKQIFYAHTDTYLSMMFATSCTTIEDAENEFTDESEKLQTRQGG
jgi:hypothetical protein